MKLAHQTTSVFRVATSLNMKVEKELRKCRTTLWELDILSGKYVWKAVGFLSTHMPLSGFALLQCQ